MTEIIPMDMIRESALAEQTLIGLAQRIAVLTSRDYCGCGVWLHVILDSTRPSVEWTGFCGQHGAKTAPTAEAMLSQFQNYEQLKAQHIADLRQQLAKLEGTLLEPTGSLPASPLSTDGDKRPRADTARAPFEPPRSGLNAAPGELKETNQ